MLGWTHVKRGDDSGPHDFYIRQLLDRKGIAIAGIWATATRSTVALAIFAEASADQNERDHHAPPGCGQERAGAGGRDDGVTRLAECRPCHLAGML